MAAELVGMETLDQLVQEELERTKGFLGSNLGNAYAGDDFYREQGIDPDALHDTISLIMQAGALTIALGMGDSRGILLAAFDLGYLVRGEVEKRRAGEIQNGV